MSRIVVNASEYQEIANSVQIHAEGFAMQFLSFTDMILDMNVNENNGNINIEWTISNLNDLLKITSDFSPTIFQM
ncbi:MAG: hypothetical protein ACI97N_002638 [Cognaticolwellia sp.]|jgi:hypothetical protein